MKITLPRPIGIAFSGGLARVPTQIGMYTELSKTSRLTYELVSGTSTGAINAALFARDPLTWQLSAQALWQAVAHDRALSSVWRSTMRSITNSAANRTRGLILKHLNIAFGDLTFEELAVPLTLVATDLASGTPISLREGSVVEAILASCSFPVVTPPLAFDTHLLTDGSLVSGVPIEPLLRDGARSVVVLDAGSSEVSEAEVTDAAWYEVMALAATHMLRVQADHDITLAARKVPVLQITTTAGSPFDLKAAPELVAAGELATQNVMRRLAKRPSQKTIRISKPGWYPLAPR
jgi:NTE family protein